jgi:hypothetical protein
LLKASPGCNDPKLIGAGRRLFGSAAREFRYPAPMRRRRKSSTRITLVLLGAAALAGCGADGDDGTRRDVYASKEDCVADWGSEQECAPATAQEHRSGGRAIWFGPTYRSGSSSSRGSGAGSSRSGSRSIGSTGRSTSRGGFGSSGRSSGSSAS